MKSRLRTAILVTIILSAACKTRQTACDTGHTAVYELRVISQDSGTPFPFGAMRPKAVTVYRLPTLDEALQQQEELMNVGIVTLLERKP